MTHRNVTPRDTPKYMPRQPNKKSNARVIEIRVYLPLKLSKSLANFTEQNHIVSKSAAIVKILEARLFPSLDGHHA